MDGVEVLPVHEARSDLTRILHNFRSDPDSAEDVVFGSHRTREAVIVPYRRYVRAREAPAVQPLRRRLHTQRRLIERLARASRIAGVRVFGSVARGEDGPDSDIDLLVDPETEASLFDFAQFQEDMEALTGRAVDVVSRRSLDPERDAHIIREAQPL